MAEGTVIDRADAHTPNDTTKGTPQTGARVADLQCVNEAGFMEWLERFAAIVNKAQPDTPIADLVRMVQMDGPVRPEWVQACAALMRKELAPTGRTYTREDAAQAVQDVTQAIAILQAVRVAVDAVEDGSMAFECKHVSRWGPAVGAATRRIDRVRALLGSKVNEPALDWFTSLAMLEALDSALWHGTPLPGESDPMEMTPAQVMTMAAAIIEELETLAQDLQTHALASVKNG